MKITAFKRRKHLTVGISILAMILAGTSLGLYIGDRTSNSNVSIFPESGQSNIVTLPCRSEGTDNEACTIRDVSGYKIFSTETGSER